VFSAAPQRGDEAFRVTGLSLEMELAECFPTPALGQKQRWLEAPTTDFGLAEVSDETFRCLQAHGKRVDDVVGPYQFRLYNGLLLKAVKAANSRSAADDRHYGVTELQGFLDEVGVCHVPAPVAEYLARHFPRKDGGQKYFVPLENYNGGTRQAAENYALGLGHMLPFAQAEQAGRAAMAAAEAAEGAVDWHRSVGCSHVSAGQRAAAADAAQFELDARSVVGQRLGWSNSLKRKIEDFFYRVAATSRGDGPRLVEVNFSSWAREDIIAVRSPLTLTHGVPEGDDEGTVLCRHAATREEVAVDWAMKIRWVPNATEDSVDDSYPEIVAGREAPFFTVASGRRSMLKTLVRQLV